MFPPPCFSRPLRGLRRSGAADRDPPRPARRCTPAGARALLVAAALIVSARAELEWKQPRLLVEAPPGADEVPGVFEFVNRGRAPVRIVSVRSDCGCTVTAGENEVIAPGAKGAVRTVFHVGARRGKQAVAVAVATQEPQPREYQLALEVDIPDFATVTPGFVSWKLGDDLQTKFFQVTLFSDFRFVNAECTTGDFSVEPVRHADGTLQLRVAPRDTWAKRNAAIRITVAKPGESPIEVLAFARVL